MGFFLGALFVYGADILMSRIGVTSPADMLLASKVKKEDPDDPQHPGLARCESGEATSVNVQEGLRRRRAENGDVQFENLEVEERKRKEEHWRRILLLIVAVTVHNIPEGLAVGVGFGAIGRTKSATFESARNLALGIGIQNFPEGVGAMVYVVVDDIVPEAQSQGNGRAASWGAVV